eukprot:TRINITY_DN7504_c2_g1_i1.p1 TRINITY_DN7504_c2_g1~~TRINITY_DN7504_c2_g1_i1.p1  ORF type:complete len:129 (-),score=29.26 TRINITY_DN7504_c2_g1_i1:71-409(-)
MNSKTPVIVVSQFLKEFKGALNQKFIYDGTDIGTLLHWGCLFQNKEIVEFLLSQSEIDLDSKFECWTFAWFPDLKNKTALEIATMIKNPNYDIIDLLKNRNMIVPQPWIQLL